MSESVLVGLIAALASLFGVLIGGLINLVSSRQNAGQEAERRLWTEKHIHYTQLLQCYNAFIAWTSAIPASPGLPEEHERELFTQFQGAYTSAILLCDEATIEVLSTFHLETSRYGESHCPSPVLHEAYLAAVHAMRKEILPPKQISKQHHKGMSSAN